MLTRKEPKVVAGLMRHRVKIQKISSADDSDGGQTRTWTTLDEVWAGIDSGLGVEGIQGAQVDSSQKFVFTMRPYAGLDPTMRLVKVDGARVFNVVTVNNPMELGALMTVVCREDTSGADD